MFDKEFAREQVSNYLTEDLKKIYLNRAKGDYVPEFYELVEIELGKRGINISDFEKKEIKKEAQKASVFHASAISNAQMLIRSSIIEKLQIGNLTDEELTLAYIWESQEPFVALLLEEELKKREFDPEKLVKPAVKETPKTDEGGKECPKCGVSVKETDNYCSYCGRILLQ